MKLDYANLARVDEWRLIEARLKRMAEDFVDEMLAVAERGEFLERLPQLAGRVAMIKDLIFMAHNIAKETPQQEYMPGEKE